MIDLKQATELVLAQCHPLPAETVELARALFRTLAGPVTTDIDQPPFDRSSMDGFAVRAADTDNSPSELEVVAQIAAGEISAVRLQPGQAVQINTGAPVPPGADAVVRIEDTRWDRDQNRVKVLVAIQRGQSITPRGQYRGAGDQVLPAGTVLTPPNVGVCATAGAVRVVVHRRPRVGILVTGGELVDPSVRPAGGQIRNSNQFVLDALIRASHCEPVALDPVGDVADQIRRRIENSAGWDVLCLTGGVSMGEFDFVPKVLADLGATVHFHRLAIKPGRPTLFASRGDGRIIFGLPGNPISAMIAFRLLVRPALAALQGRCEPVRRFRAILDGGLPMEGKRLAFYPAAIAPGENSQPVARLLSWMGSGDALGIAGADAFVVRPPGSPPTTQGEAVEFIPLD